MSLYRAVVVMTMETSRIFREDFTVKKSVIGEVQFKKDCTRDEREEELRKFIPPVEEGFRRVSLSVAVSFDGTMVNWSVQDEEVRKT